MCLPSFGNNLRFVPAVACGSCLCIFLSLQYPSECLYHNLCMLSVVDGHLGCFQFSTKINATVNMSYVDFGARMHTFLESESSRIPVFGFYTYSSPKWSGQRTLLPEML